eukprot:TRINITY_DN29373_c0_g1_i1.p1 TRINITY_DN29373_c0_g1~~TRINITY_DN29373_c0_g1_i1.p1  ORF type:complete len:536 (-),score=147.96 TRINITY_DN29373_c0_g1_i1:289-1896(-)
MIRRPPRSTLSSSSAASDVYKKQYQRRVREKASNMAATDLLFVYVAAVLVLFMHVGFSMLEVGTVQPKNRGPILLKNVMCLAIGGISWWAVGYLIATGVNMSTRENHGFIGTSDGDDTLAFLKDVDKSGDLYVGWFFGFAFAATSATIVSGAVAERIQYRAFFIFATILTGFIYPVVAYWGWASDGWLKVAGNKNDANKGYLDFAGSGVVHMVGGSAALVAIIVLGPRKFMTIDHTVDGKPIYAPRFEFHEDTKRWHMNTPHNDNSGLAFCALGTLILWVGWFGFNPGSQLAISTTNDQKYVGLAVVNTTLGPCASVVTYAILAGIVKSNVDVSGCLNAALTGLVAITANCNYTEPWAAVLIGAVAAPVYVGSSKLLKTLRIDDVIDAVPVHFFGGMWGVFSTGLLVSDDLAGSHDAGLFYDGSALIGWQICGIVAITAWSAAFSFLCFYLMNLAGILRVSDTEEMKGMALMMQEWAEANNESADLTTAHRPKPMVRLPPSPRLPPQQQTGDIEDGESGAVKLPMEVTMVNKAPS